MPEILNSGADTSVHLFRHGLHVSRTYTIMVLMELVVTRETNVTQTASRSSRMSALRQELCSRGPGSESLPGKVLTMSAGQ